MLKPFRPILLLPIILPLSIAMTACSGGGANTTDETTLPVDVSDSHSNSNGSNDSRDDTPDNQIEEAVRVSPDDFRLAELSGVWRLTSDFHHLDHQQESVDMDTTIPRDVESQVKINSILAWNYVDDSHIAVKDCFQLASEVLNIDQFNRISIPVSENGNDFDETICDAPLDLDYYIISDSHFRLDAQCHGNKVGTVSYDKLSTQSGFHQGTLNFVVDAAENLSATSGVCGSRLQIDNGDLPLYARDAVSQRGL